MALPSEFLPKRPAKEDFDREFEGWFIWTRVGLAKGPEEEKLDWKEHFETSKKIYESLSYALLFRRTDLKTVLDESEKWRRRLCQYSGGLSKKYYEVVPKLIESVRSGYFKGPGFFESAIDKLGSYTEGIISEKGGETAKEFLDGLPKYLGMLDEALCKGNTSFQSLALEELEKFLDNPSGYSLG